MGQAQITKYFRVRGDGGLQGPGMLGILFPFSKLCLLDCTSVLCIVMFFLLAEAEKGEVGSGNLTCICSVRILGICARVFKPMPPYGVYTCASCSSEICVPIPPPSGSLKP